MSAKSSLVAPASVQRAPADPQLAQLEALVDRLAELGPSHLNRLFGALRELSERMPPALRLPEDATFAERQRAARVLLAHLPSFVGALREDVEAELARIGSALEAAGASSGSRFDPEVVRAVRTHAAQRLFAEHLGEASQLGRALGALAGDRDFCRALSTLGLSHLTMEDLTVNVLSSVSVMLERAGAAMGHRVDGQRLAFGDGPAAEKRAARLEQAFGPTEDAQTHLLVTLDGAAAKDREFLVRLFDAGMSSIRINCAHETVAAREQVAITTLAVGLSRYFARMEPAALERLVAQVQQAAEQLGLPQPASADEAALAIASSPRLRLALDQAGLLVGRPHVSADLAGPKNRTGYHEPQEGVVKVDVPRDRVGVPLTAAARAAGEPLGNLGKVRFGLTAEGAANTRGEPVLPLSADPSALEHLAKALESGGEGVALVCRDAGGTRKRLVQVEGVVRGADGSIVGLDARCERSTYFTTGLALELEVDGALLPLGQVGALPTTGKEISLQDGDLLVIKADPGYLGHGPRGLEGETPATIGCLLPEALQFVEEGHAILLDDGKVHTVAEEVRRDAAGQVTEVVVRLRRKGEQAPVPVPRKFGPEKGINFPDSDLQLPALTDKDLEDLPFVVRHADVISYSFVQTAADVAYLAARVREVALAEGLATPETLDAFLAQKTLCAKIETKKALANVEEILVAVERAGFNPMAMIARGDLAVELGFERLGRAQLALADRLRNGGWPFIYATQLMETLAKKDVDTRPEWVDADVALNEVGADVLMFNKGPHMDKVLAMVGDFARHRTSWR